MAARHAAQAEPIRIGDRRGPRSRERCGPQQCKASPGPFGWSPPIHTSRAPNYDRYADLFQEVFELVLPDPFSVKLEKELGRMGHSGDIGLPALLLKHEQSPDKNHLKLTVSFSIFGSPCVSLKKGNIRQLYQDLPTGGFRSLTGVFWAPVVTKKHLLERPGSLSMISKEQNTTLKPCRNDEKSTKVTDWTVDGAL